MGNNGQDTVIKGKEQNKMALDLTQKTTFRKGNNGSSQLPPMSPGRRPQNFIICYNNIDGKSNRPLTLFGAD